MTYYTCRFAVKKTLNITAQLCTNLFKKVCIFLTLPTLALGQTIPPLPISENIQQVSSPSVTKATAATRLVKTTRNRTWIRQYAVPVVGGAAAAIITAGYIWHLQSQNQNLTKSLEELNSLKNEKDSIALQKAALQERVEIITHQEKTLQQQFHAHEKMSHENSVFHQFIKTHNLQAEFNAKCQLHPSLFEKFPHEVLGLILGFCNLPTIANIARVNHATHGRVERVINTYPSIFFKKTYPRLLNLHTDPVNIYTVPPLDLQLLIPPSTPVMFFRNLPHFFAHEGMLPLPYLQAFFTQLDVICAIDKCTRGVFNAYPLPLLIVPQIKPSKINPIGHHLASENLRNLREALPDTKTLEASVKAIQHPHIILRAIDTQTINHYDGVIDYASCPYASLLQHFLIKFYNSSLQTAVQSVSMDHIIHRFISGFIKNRRSTDDSYAQINTLYDTATCFKTLHFDFNTDDFLLYPGPTVPKQCTELVLRITDKLSNHPQYPTNWDSEFIQKAFTLLTLCSISGAKLSYNHGDPILPQTIQRLRLLNYNLQLKNLDANATEQLATYLFYCHDIPHLIIHVPEGWELTETIKTELQFCVDSNAPPIRKLQSITLMSPYNGTNWDDSWEIFQVKKVLS